MENNSAAAPSTTTEPTEVSAASSPVEEKTTITFDDFVKVELVVGQILEAEAVAGSEKLLKLRVDLGAERGERQILAGIAKHYPADEVIGRKIVVVANLKPRKMMGMLSEGMLLAASNSAGGLELINPGTTPAPGTRVS
ncbi:MAG: methionine--tRNA ligase subunit beta [Bdellovibrionales bacterium]|nr:methionine--tRNA ligase subunit beta [Bdellovibrionales bacterium]